MKVPAADQVAAVLKAKNHAVFDTPEDHNLNLVGIRAGNARPNRFDDLLVCFSRLREQWCFMAWACTTDPGRYWLEHPMNDLGTAILKPGQYRGAYELGMHQGQYEALVQRRPVTVIRDADRDADLDLNGLEETGLFGINIHCAGWKRIELTVDKWSAGCQVVQNWWDFQVLIAICEAAAQEWGNSFTYTLIEEKDLTQ